MQAEKPFARYYSLLLIKVLVVGIFSFWHYKEFNLFGFCFVGPLVTSEVPRTRGSAPRERWIPHPGMGLDYLCGAAVGGTRARKHLWVVKNEAARYYFSFNSPGVAWLCLR